MERFADGSVLAKDAAKVAMRGAHMHFAYCVLAQRFAHWHAVRRLCEPVSTCRVSVGHVKVAGGQLVCTVPHLKACV